MSKVISMSRKVRDSRQAVEDTLFDVGNRFKNGTVCHLLHAAERIEGGEYGYAKMIMMTPKLAAAALAINTENRPKSKPRSDSYMRMMLEYLWYVGADALIVFEDEETHKQTLGNGQTRLTALIDSGLEGIPMLVRYGVNPKEFKYIDKQRARNDAISNKMDSDHVQLVKFFHKIATNNNARLNVIEVARKGEAIKEAYAASRIVKKVKSAKLGVLAAFVYVYMTAKSEESRLSAMNKWRVFNVGITDSGHEDDKYTNLMIALTNFVNETKRGSYESTFDLFKRACPMFVDGNHHNVMKAPASVNKTLKEECAAILSDKAE